MDFRTIVDLSEYDFRLDHTHKCMFIGSCFSENIGEKLKKTKIYTSVNPTGIHYNPHSIAKSLKTLINNSKLHENELFYSNGLWNSYNFHSKFSGMSKEETLENINNSIEDAHFKLKELDYLFVTFGTSYAYYLKENGYIVSNCHKQPSANFTRIFLTPGEIVCIWNELIEDLHSFNPEIKIIFTVSPIRHWKDGATNNAYSKSSLLLSIKEMLEKYKLYYFPAFEIVNDELRDYRFYADDMFHPSNTAIEYIWERFCSSFFSDETKSLNKRINKISAAINHRPFNRHNDEYKIFCNNMLQEIYKLQKEFPYIDFETEELYFSNNS